MSGTDANGASWLMLSTEQDFVSRALATGQLDPSGPAPGAGVAYDPTRHALELSATPAATRNRVLPSRAIDVDGRTYLVVDDMVVVEHCDGSRAVPMTDPAMIGEPAGMAIDRRGLLHVADRSRAQVVVISPDDGRVEARITDPSLREPVDVAVAADGTIAVADRGGRDILGIEPGQILLFGADHELERRWEPRNASTPPRPRRPRPIAVFWRGDELVVADAFHPRLIGFDRSGNPTGEHETELLAADVSDELDAESGRPRWSFRNDLARLVGLCGCPPELDVGVAMARAHRALRLRELSLHQSFRTCGTWVSAVLDSGVANTEWHRVELQVELPEGTRVRIDTATSDDPDLLLDIRDLADAPLGCGPRRPPDAPDQVGWDVLFGRDGEPVAFGGAAPREAAPRFEYDLSTTVASVREQLIVSGPGRYIRLRIVLTGDAAATPTLSGLRLVVPRHTYRHDLPAVFSDDSAARRFLDGFLSLFERTLSGIEDRRDEFYRTLGPAAAPPEVLTWLAALLDLSFDPSWPLARRRALVAEAIELYRRRGTPAGIARYVEIYTGIDPIITEDFLERPGSAGVAGNGAILGTTIGLGVAPAGAAPPDEAQIAAYAHRFTVHLPMPDDCQRELMVPVIDRIVSATKPAHSEHRLRVVDADSRVGIDTTVGLDLVLGARSTPRTRLGADSPILGGDTVIGRSSPHPRPPDHIL